MRKSLARRQLSTANTAKRFTYRRLRRALLWALVPIAGLGCALFLVSAEQQREKADAAYQKQATSEAVALKSLSPKLPSANYRKLALPKQKPRRRPKRMLQLKKQPPPLNPLAQLM